MVKYRHTSFYSTLLYCTSQIDLREERLGTWAPGAEGGGLGAWTGALGRARHWVLWDCGTGTVSGLSSYSCCLSGPQ